MIGVLLSIGVGYLIGSKEARATVNSFMHETVSNGWNYLKAKKAVTSSVPSRQDNEVRRPDSDQANDSSADIVY